MATMLRLIVSLTLGFLAAERLAVNAPFKSGEIIVKELATTKGTVEMAAETVINGRSLLLKVCRAKLAS